MLNHKTIKTIAIIILLAIEFSLAGGRNDKEVVQQTATQEIDTTKTEKYERKVIIKAKVGSGPGEVGVIGGPDEDGARGIAVDGDGNIFILDNQNKRILSFSSNGKCQKVIPTSDIENYLEGLGNHLLIDESGNFYVTHRLLRLGDRIKSKYKYDKSGNILAQECDIPTSLLNMEAKSVTGDIPMYTFIQANRDTVVHYYILDSTRNTKYTINVHLPMRNGWKYAVNSYSFLGFDKENNAYITVTALEDVPFWPPKKCMERAWNAKEEWIVFKYNEEGKLIAEVKENTPGIGFEFWTLGHDGALYLLKYSFKYVVTDELPDWVKNDPNMPDEEKKKWRREYTAPEGHVYVVKFSKVEEK